MNSQKDWKAKLERAHFLGSNLVEQQCATSNIAQLLEKYFGNSKVVLTLAVSVGLSAILYVLHSLISYVLHVYRRKITNRNRKIASIDIKKEDNSLKFDDIVSSIKGTSFQKHSHPLSISIYEIIVIKPPNKYLLHNFDLFFSNLFNNCLCFTHTFL